MLLVATPTRGDLQVGYVRGLLELRQAEPFEWLTVQGSCLPKMRDRIAAAFIRGECTHLVAIDDDTVFRADDVLTLVEAADEVGGIVSAMVPRKARDPQQRTPCVSLAGEPRGELERCHAIGGGFFVVPRSAMATVWEACAPLEYWDEPTGQRLRALHMAALAMTPDGSVVLPSEDLTFSARCVQAGVSLWAHTGVRVQHTGRFDYELAPNT